MPHCAATTSRGSSAARPLSAHDAVGSCKAGAPDLPACLPACVHALRGCAAGVGDDSILIGLVELVQVPPNECTLWVTTGGQVTCADANFVSASG